MKQTLIIVTLLLSVTLITGCGGGGLNLVPASGVVLYEGVPLTEAAVNFLPEDPAAGRSAVAVTDADGRFVMMTQRSGDGIVPGKYKVTVTKFEAPKVTESKTSDPDTPAENNKDDVKSLIPERYNSPLTSDLTAEVPKNGTKELKFNLVK